MTTLPKTDTFLSDSPDATRHLAAQLAGALPDGAILALHGDLGSGKTCFVQGLADAFAVQEPVTSPTFTLVNEYHGHRRLTHIDLYRLNHADEALDFGLEEYLEGEGLTAIEWAERAGDLLPCRALHLSFEVGDQPDHRRIRLVRPHWDQLLECDPLRRLMSSRNRAASS